MHRSDETYQLQDPGWITGQRQLQPELQTRWKQVSPHDPLRRGPQKTQYLSDRPLKMLQPPKSIDNLEWRATANGISYNDTLTSFVNESVLGRKGCNVDFQWHKLRALLHQKIHIRTS
ncbi:hypothetical protein K504DRAFT_505348 [Pleomassaria siparia CBS 279.74]|uniref:Uncharacterized protein n=1 Tax=Pleomassaria siparia CBS 279.74 TaxID=1314801 RepID=A0A6G1K1C0_9PLEO|nr:hypothetical protein K504DRAFT_505348 [Pleomassaria siparia CBS 279.74]